MKQKPLLFAVALALFVMGTVFAQTEDAEIEYAALAEQVNACIDNGDYAGAIPLLKRMHELMPDELVPVEYLGTFYTDGDRPEFTNALFWLLEAEKRNSTNNYVYYNLACIYSLKNDLDKSIQAMNKALVFGYSGFKWMSQDDDLVNFRTTSWWKGIVDNYAQIEKLFVEFNEFNEIAEEKSIEEKLVFYNGIITSLNKLAPQISALKYNPLLYLANSYYSTGNYTKFIECYLEIKTIVENTLGKDHPNYATSLNNLGVLYRDMGDYAQAEKYDLEVIGIRERVLGKDHPSYTTSLNNLGSLYYTIGDYEKAEQYYLESIAIAERVLGEDHPNYAMSLNNLGVLYSDMGDYAQAEKYYLESIAIVEWVLGKDHPDYATSLNNMGGLYYSMGDYAQAEQYYLESIAIVEWVLGKDHPDYATSLNNLGFLYNKMEDYAQAEKYYLESLGIRERVWGKDHPDYANSLNNLGGLYDSMGDYAQAEKYYLEAIGIRERVLGKDHPSYAGSLNNLSCCYLGSEKYVQALILKKDVHQLNENTITRNFAFMSGHQRNAYWNANSFSFELSYSISWFYPVPESTILNYDNALFSKGLLLRTTNAVRDSIYASGNQPLVSQYEELGKLRQQISALRQSGGSEEYIKSLEIQADALDKSLTQASAAFREFQADLNVNWQDVQKSLQEKEAAIEFVSFRLYDKKWTDITQYAALVLKPGMEAPMWIPLCEETVLAELFEKAQGGNPFDQTQILYDEYGNDFYKAIWQPLEKALEGIDVIYYSPSGLLHKIAFNAIPVNKDTRLMDKYDLHLVSSTREIVSRKNKTAQKPSSAVLYGGLFYDADEGSMRLAAAEYAHATPALTMRSWVYDSSDGGIKWSYLDKSEPESREIHQFFNQNKIAAERFSGNRGNEESFKALSGKKTTVIHLATHGFFFEDIEKNYEDRDRLERLGGGQKALENPLLRSGLILSGGNNAWLNKTVEGVEDGILFADEVANLNLLGTDLVVMSACETALGGVNNSEGVFGLQRAFKLAGVNTLIMSLWKVSDEATSILMRAFYSNWLSGMSKHDSLKEAQKVLRESPNYSSPYFWAAFVMMD